MKRLAVLAMVGSLAFTGIVGGISTAKAAEARNIMTTCKDKNIDFRELDKDFFAEPGKILPKADSLSALTEILKKDKKLTKEEKKALTEAYEKIVKNRKSIDSIADKIESITKKITNNWAIEEKLDKLANKHQSLWDKLYENATDEQLAIEDNIEFIKSSKALTDKEKDTLIKTQTELDTLGKEYDKLYGKVEKATKTLSSRLDALYSDIEKLMDEVKPLADKLGKKFKENFGFGDIMPY